ncbi:D-2-hydroxyacid dehydrogenase [Erysipelotrichaceae bacterium OttesenSCG-928-M19]|nr:D-2-hydroxyacid dehydrogenase [Erysipelotrichaceae bacterium OttesenSCG-928-M19]
MKIFIYGVHDGEFEPIDEYLKINNIKIEYTTEQLNSDTVSLAQGFDGISIKQSNHITDESIYKKLNTYNIKQIALRTAGYDMIDLKLANKYNLTITNVPAYSPNAIAEMALTHTMFLLRKMYLTIPRIKSHNFTWPGLLAPEIRNLTIGIIGVGRIGGVYAKLVSGLGAKVIGYDIVRREHENPVVEYQETLNELLRKADIISIHTPHDDSTENMINKKTLKLMKPTAYLINTARGPIVNSRDLIDALENKELAGAGLDTLDCEINYFQHNYHGKEIKSKELKKLLQMENVLITPHISFFTKTALKNMIDISLDSAIEVLTSKTSKNIVK